MNLLLIDADALFVQGLAAELRTRGHQVATHASGRAALPALDSEAYDALLIDWMPGGGGIDLLRRVREGGMRLPVVLLSGSDRMVDRLEGLEAGADDVLVKPLVVAELEARLHAIRRGRGWGASGSDTFRVDDIVISPAAHRASRGGRAIDLAAIEFTLLVELARNAGAVLNRTHLLERVWGGKTRPAANVVDSYICRLRTKLTAEGEADPIVTRRGVGYMLRP